MPRCQLCGSPAPEGRNWCTRACAHAAKEAAKDGIEARLRRAFARRRRPPGAAPSPEAEQMFFEVGGFWAPGCAGAAEEILKCAPGVFDAQVVAETGRGRAYYDPEQTGPRELQRALRRYGFRATRVRDAWARAEGFSRAWEIALAVRLGVAATLTIHVLYLSALLHHWDRIRSAREAETVTVLMFFLTLPVLLYAGLPILTNAAWAVARRRVTADLLTAAAAVGAFALSLPGLFENGPVYFDAACAAVVLTLFARFCEYRARRRLARTGEKLAGLLSGSAIRLRRGEEIPCASSELRPGDAVVVGTGTRVPVDGDVVDGNGAVEPVMGGATEVSPGDRVAAGGRLRSGRLVVRAERTGAGTAVGEIARIVEGAIGSHMPGSVAASRGLIILGGAVVVAGLLALSFGPSFETPALAALAAALLAASPSALALLPSISALSAMGRAAERAVFFRGGDALAAAAGAGAAVLHRSALVEARSEAAPCVVAAPAGEFWAVVATLVAVTPGPAAAALRERARMEGASPLVPVAPTEGRVARAHVEGKDAAMGDRQALEALGWSAVPEVARARAEEERGRSLVWVGWDGEIRGAIALDAPARKGAEDVGPALRRAGILACLAGPDAEAALDAQANRLGLDTWLIEDRLAQEIATRRSRGRRTVLAARSSHEAPAGVEECAVACAVDCGEEGAPDWAGVVSLGPDPRAVEVALGAARRAQAARRIGGSLAFLFHAAVLPCAAAGLLTPLLAVGISGAFGLYVIYVAFRAGGNPMGR